MLLRSLARTPLFLSVMALGLAFYPGEAAADMSRPVTFDSVTAYTIGTSPRLAITGVQHGAGVSSTVSFLDSTGSSDMDSVIVACERQLLVMINRPGRFSITIATDASYPVGATATLYRTGCTLTQRP